MPNVQIKENIYDVSYEFTIPVDLYNVLNRRYLREFAKSKLTFNDFYERHITDTEKKVIMAIEGMGDNGTYSITFKNID